MLSVNITCYYSGITLSRIKSLKGNFGKVVSMHNKDARLRSLELGLDHVFPYDVTLNPAAELIVARAENLAFMQFGLNLGKSCWPLITL